MSKTINGSNKSHFLLLLRPRKKPQTLLELTRSRRCKVRLLMLRPFTPSSAQCLRSASGNGLGLGGMKVFRHGHQSSSIGDPNPHGEGLSFFKGSNRGGGYYRMKMSICASAFESDACLQVIRVISMFRFYVAHSQPFYISSCNYRLVISTRRWFPMCG